MTRKDYELIAAAILGERASAEARECDISKRIDQWVTLGKLAVRLSQVFAHGNERFDSDRFLAACGMSDEEIAATREYHEFHRLALLRSLTEKAGA